VSPHIGKLPLEKIWRFQADVLSSTLRPGLGVTTKVQKINYKALLFASLTVLLPASAHAQSQQEINQCIQSECSRVSAAIEAAMGACMEAGETESVCICDLAPEAEVAMRQCEASCQGN